jgi:tetratricopeptide (TPR) repeat protein
MQPAMKRINRGATLFFILLLSTFSAFAQNKRDEAKAAVAAEDYTTAARLYDEILKESPKDKGILVEAADVAMELDRFTVARDLYQRALDIDSKDPAVNRKYGLVLSELGDHSKAVEAIRRALKYDENSLENYMALGHAYIAAGKDSLSKAELTIMSARDKFIQSAQPYVALGDLYFARGVYELAQSQYEEALKRDSLLIEPRVKFGRSYRELAKRAASDSESNDLYNKALLEFNRVTSLAPKNARAWYEQGEIFMLAHRFEEAGRSFQEYTKLRPEDPRGDIMLARAAYGGNFFTVAIEPLERILTKSDSLSMEFIPQARVMLAKSYYAGKNFAKAQATYALVPDSLMNEEALKLYGSAILNSGGDTSKAITVYQKLLALNPKNCEMSLSFAGLLYNLKRYDDVISVLNNRLANCPEEPKGTPYLYIGLANYAQKRNDQAIAAFSSAIQADSSKFDPYFWLANVYAAGGQFDKLQGVVHDLDQQKLVEPNAKKVSQLYLQLGNERFKAKDYAKALGYLTQSSKLDPNNASAYLLMAFSYQLQNDKEKACEYYHKVLQVDPNNADAKKNMKALGCP